MTDLTSGSLQLTLPLHKALRERPDHLAVVCGDEHYSYAAFVDRVQRLAAVLRDAGLKPGDRVGMLALNSARTLEFFFGVWWAGGVINPVNVRWTAAEIVYSLDDCDTALLLIDEAHARHIDALRAGSHSLRTLLFCGAGPAPQGTLALEPLLRAAVPVEDAHRGGYALASILYTGGTTGRPKGVMLSHANLFLSVLGQVAALPRRGNGVGLVAAPMFHVGGLGLALIQVLQLATVVVLPAFEELAVLRAIAEHRVSETFMVPTMLKRLIEHPEIRSFDLASLHLVIYGAAPIDAPLLGRAMDALPGVDFAQAYGMTELSSTVSLLRPEQHWPGPEQARRLRSAGRPLPTAELRIVDSEGQELPRGAVGEIIVRSPMTMQGYWGLEDQTRGALRAGWMHTGDAGHFDEEGLLHVVDRLKDMIISGGENIYSAEVEDALARMPQVSACAVIGVPDDTLGERVHAVVVLRPGQTVTLAQIVAHCKTLIAGYKCPRSIELREQLPLSAAGKLQKFELRKPYLAENHPAGERGPRLPHRQEEKP